MKNFKVLDHPADIGIIAYGKNLEDLFINSSIGVTSLMIDTETLSKELEKIINIEGGNIDDLFTKWLDEIIYLSDSEGYFVKEIDELKIINDALSKVLTLQARLKGEKYKKEKHQVKLYLKAVTYHQLKIKQTKEGWKATVYFDV